MTVRKQKFSRAAIGAPRLSCVRNSKPESVKPL
jgi:hypothetical protein